MKHQLNIFFNAMLFFTRVPVPRSVVCNDHYLSKAFRYLPLIGLLIGVLCALCYSALALVLPREICIVCIMLLSILLTGAFHEDGLADFVDGFGAGRDRDSILRIMKDSHIGTYGVIALILALLLKFQLLCQLEEQWLLPALVIAPTLSRFYPVLIVRLSSYARTESSKASHSARGVSATSLAIAALSSLTLPWCWGWMFACVLLASGFVLSLGMHLYMKKRIGGFTGDCLGALQQLTELLFYLILLALSSQL